MALWDSIPTDVKKRVIAWAVVSAILWTLKLAFGVGLLLVGLFIILAIATTIGHLQGAAWSENQIIRQIRGLILPPMAVAVLPDLWHLFKLLAIERSLDALLGFTAFAVVVTVIFLRFNEAIRNMFKRR